MKQMKHALLAWLPFLSWMAHAGTARISGKMASLHDGDTVQVYTEKYGEPNFIGFRDFSSGAVEVDSFHVEVPVGNYPQQIENIKFSKQDRNLYFMNLLLEDGDDIHISMQNGHFVITGKGAAKWKLSKGLDSIYYAAMTGLPYGTPDYARALFEAMDSMVLKQLTYLEARRNTVTRKVYVVLRANTIGQFYVKSENLSGLPPDQYAAALASLRAYSCGIDPSAWHGTALDKDTAVLCADIYANGFADAWRFDSCTLAGKPFSTERYYRYIVRHFTSLIRERLITNALYKARDNGEDITAFVADALRYVQYGDFRGILETLRSGRVTGAAAFRFDLPDITGTRHRQEDFNGKVVLLDFWFTGCGNCVRIHPYLDSIRRLFGGKPFELVSVNTDTDRDWWAESLRGGKYTSADETNIWTEGRGDAHPMLRYYLVDACPDLVLVDKKGRLMRVPLDPRKDGGENLVELIREGLAKK